MKVLLAALVALALGVGLAAAFVPSQAATVGGTGISQATLYGDLSTIAHASDYRCLLQTGQSGALGAAGSSGTTTGRKGGYSTSFTDEWLDQLIGDQLTANLVRQKGLSVTAKETSWARGALERAFSQQLTSSEGACGDTGSAVLSQLPASFQDTLVTGTADKLVLAFHAAGVTPTTSGLQGYYSTHATAFNKVCVTLIEYRTSTTAAQTVTQIEAGTLTFATAVAKVEATKSSQTARAGSLCRDLAGGTPTPVLGAAPGALVGPESGTGVYYVSEVTSSTNRPFATARGEVVTAVISAGQTTVNKSLRAELKRTTISVDPRFGALSATGVVPPTSPPAATVLTPTANVPGAR